MAGRADYCGVNKKTIFTVGNYLLPKEGRLSMHCSANVGAKGDGAILFGLSGTGKTTLSADASRRLIGDDETIWSDNGLCNLEDGCYAKLIDLDKHNEPVIAEALSKAGTIIENVPPLPGKTMEECHPDELDLFDGSLAENTRFSYPLDANPNVMPNGQGPHPQTIVLLTADAFGVLPPISILEPKDVMYHFVSGFTARVAGTEVGVTEPQPTFSACFGGPFMAQKPNVYAALLAKKMEKHKARCILLNTGWSGGPYGTGKTHVAEGDARAAERCTQRRTRQRRNRNAADPEVEDAEIVPRRGCGNSESAQHLGRQRFIRHHGDQAARHVPQEFRNQGLCQVWDRRANLGSVGTIFSLHQKKPGERRVFLFAQLFCSAENGV